MTIECSNKKMGRKKKQQQPQQAQEKEEFTRPTRSSTRKKRDRNDSETSIEIVVDKAPVAKVSKKKRERTASETSNDAVVDKGVESRMTKEVPGKKKNKKNDYDPVEEARLEQLVFGDPSSVIKNLQGDSDDEELQAVDDDDKDVVVPVCTLPKDDDDKDSIIMVKWDNDNESIISVNSKTSHREAAWRDEDDEQLGLVDALKQQHRRLPGEKDRPEKTYNQFLANKHAHVMGPTPKWANLDQGKSDSEDSDSEILKHSNRVASNKSKYLRKGTIDLKVMAHLNKQTHLEGPFVNVVQFHEMSTVAMVAGATKQGGVLSLFQVDGKNNNKLHSVQFTKFPIHSARFLRQGNEILVGSMSYDYCYSFDLMTERVLRIPLPHGITNMKKFEVSPDGKVIAICGRLGEVHLLYSNTKEIIGTLKMNKKCRDLAFTPDSSKLLTHGEGSEVYVWDIASRQCINRAYDDGCLSGMSIATSPNSQFIATGSKQGAVNIYESKSILNERTPQPVKTVLNLVTAITRLEFNPTTEILAMASDRKHNAFRMVHIPSFNVFSNFPTFNTKMHMPLDIDFSPASGFMSVSNNKGFAYLYRLKHYGNY